MSGDNFITLLFDVLKTKINHNENILMLILNISKENGG